MLWESLQGEPSHMDGLYTLSMYENIIWLAGNTDSVNFLSIDHITGTPKEAHKMHWNI
jgi:hypothetical protein